MSRKRTVLVVDDETFVRDSLRDLLEDEGYAVEVAEDGDRALEALKKHAIDVVVSDLSMPGRDGLGLLESIRGQGIDTPIILLTGVGKIADAVAAMKGGAFDFVQKPVDPGQFVLLVSRALEHRRLVDEVRFLRHAVQDLRGADSIVGESAAIEKVRALIRQVAPTDATVLVTGESGTGKELVGGEIHRLSARAERNLVCVNCSAVSSSLFESEFFGHRRGAFTSAMESRAGRFEEAESGTLVLDEISTLDPAMQAKLLRVLETGEYTVVGESSTRVADVRVVAVSNENLQELVRRGTFRADLYYRLNVFPIVVPPLRSRRDDVPLLARHFLEKYRPLAAASASGADGDFAEEALAALTSYDWPGNVRELRNVIERAVILAGKDAPDGALFESILDPARASSGMSSGEAASRSDLNIRGRVASLEKELVEEAISRADERKEAAALLGIDPKNLAYYLKKHGIGSGKGESK